MIVKLSSRLSKLEATLVQLEKNTAQKTDTDFRMQQLEETVLEMGRDKNQKKIDTFTAMKSQRRSKDDDDDDFEEEMEEYLMTYGIVLFCLITWMCICCLFCYARRVSKVSKEERRRLAQARNVQMTSSERNLMESPERPPHMYQR